jgi:hypothetical protein
MKTRSATLALLLTALALTSACVGPQTNAPLSHAVGGIARPGDTDLARGASKSEVRLALGAPSHQLSADVWAYYGFNGGRQHTENDGCSTLLLTFTNDTLTDLQLINDRAQIVYAQRIRAKENAQMLAATN